MVMLAQVDPATSLQRWESLLARLEQLSSPAPADARGASAGPLDPFLRSDGLNPSLQAFLAGQGQAAAPQLDWGSLLARMLADWAALFQNLAMAGGGRCLGSLAEAGTATPGSAANSTEPPAPTGAASTGLPPGPGLQGLKIQVIGDSLMVGAKGATQAALSGAGASQVQIDAAGGRAITGSGAGKHVSPAEIRQQAQASGANVVVVELGSNHADYARFVPETMNELNKLQPPPTVVWVNTQTKRPSKTAYGAAYYAENAQINQAIQAASARYPNLVVADWSQIAGGPGINGGDGLHLTSQGSQALADLILRSIQNARA